MTRLSSGGTGACGATDTGLRILFETPAWLAEKGRLIPPAELDFPTLFHHAYRRLTTLCAL